MMIDFGKINKYETDRGFGFVSQTFNENSYKGIFFHIKTIKRDNPSLAQSLPAFDKNSSIYFWYEFSMSPKGFNVDNVLALTDKKLKYFRESDIFMNALDKYWMDTERIVLPEAIMRASKDLLSEADLIQLEEKRKFLIEEKEKEHTEAKRLLQLKEKEVEEVRIGREKLVSEEEKEFQLLVEEVSSLNYTHSNQVSQYIRNKKLGHKYKNIAGNLVLGNFSDKWNFDGGINPKFYKRLCIKLGLQNNDSGAKPLEFTPYKDLNKG